MGCLPGSRERQTPTAGSPWFLFVSISRVPAARVVRGACRVSLWYFFRRWKEGGERKREGREEKSLVGRVWWWSGSRNGDGGGRSGGWQWERDSEGGEALNWGAEGDAGPCTGLWRARAVRRGDIGGEAPRAQGGHLGRLGAASLGLDALATSLAGGLALPLLAWCRGVDGIVGRGGRPWPIAAAQRPCGRLLAALATACFRQCTAKNSQCNSGRKICLPGLIGRASAGGCWQPIRGSGQTRCEHNRQGVLHGACPSRQSLPLASCNQQERALSSHSQLASW